MRKLTWCSAAAAALASSSAFAIKVPTGSEDVSLNINFQAQVRAVGDFGGPPTTGATPQGQAPDGSFNTDFFLRRARLGASGNVYKNFLFNILFDTPNFGRRGDYTGSTFVQELSVGYAPIPDVIIEGGFLFEQVTHVGLASSGASSIVEGPAFGSDLFINARGNRMTGVRTRALLFNHRILVRAGVYEGRRFFNPPATYKGLPVVVNPSGIPDVGGMVRYNLIGDETANGFPGIYMDGKSRISFGVGGHYQRKASWIPDAAGMPQGVADYLVYAADAFVDYALPGDTEAVMQLAGYRFDYGSNAAGKGSARTGFGAAGDIGYRFGKIEPQANFYWFNSDTKQNSYLKVAGGVNYFFRGHNAKIVAEFSSIINNGNLSTTQAIKEMLVQGQILF
jgi:hypothetical protein